jgi:hypothetical protein
MSGVESDGQDGLRRPGAFAPFQRLSTFTDVQRRGMDAAAQVIEDSLALLDTQPPPPRPRAGPANGHEPDFAQFRASVARALDLYTEVLRRSFESYADLVEQSLRARGVGLGGGDEDGHVELTMQAATGARAAGIVWLHNTTDRPAAAVLHLTGLTAHDGLVVPGAAASFEPAAVRIGPGASMAARLVVNLESVAPGVYRGHILAGGLPDAALALRVVVTSTASAPSP